MPLAYAIPEYGIYSEKGCLLLEDINQSESFKNEINASLNYINGEISGQTIAGLDGFYTGSNWPITKTILLDKVLISTELKSYSINGLFNVGVLQNNGELRASLITKNAKVTDGRDPINYCLGGFCTQTHW